MNKNISINIGSIIFHIDENGYDKLKNYLDSINAYFSSFEDSKEIIEDIEGRIAEIFLSKLDEGKQVIFLEDVDALIATMGTTQDFEASIGSETAQETEKTTDEEPQKTQEEGENQESTGSKRLYRNVKQKIIGGVASGIAHYFSIDAIWVRLLMLALFFNAFYWSMSGFMFVAYIILWIAVPENKHLEDDKAIKKLFRSMDDRVLSGVSGGIASYFGTDPVVIRVLFVISIFLGGAGIIVYLILWIITPEARSITEKMQMQGEPVTLSNIENNLKRSLNVKEGEESPFVKILLFPFRIIASIIESLSTVMRPFLNFAVEALRIFAGIILILIGFALMIAFTIAFGVLLGFTSSMGYWVQLGGFPFDQLLNSASVLAKASAYIVSMIPSLALLLIGLMIILKRKVTSAFVGWGLFGVWLLGIVGLVISIPSILSNYKTDGTYKENRLFEVYEGPVELKLNEIDWDSYNTTELKIKGHQDSLNYRLELAFESRGQSRSDAKKHAKAVNYSVKQDGNTFYFDSEISFEDDAPFRFQEVSATFYVPYGKVFVMDADLKEILRNTLWMYDYDSEDLENNQWVFDPSGLKCITCENTGKSLYQKNADASDTYEFRDFDEVKIVSFFEFEIRQGNEYSVRIAGEDDELDDVYLHQSGDELEIRYGKQNQWWKYTKKERIKLFITMPNLDYLNVIGACEGDIMNFSNDEMEIEITGASNVHANITTDVLKASLTGASNLVLIGSGKTLEAELAGTSELRAFDFPVDKVDVEVSGVSSAKVYADEELEANASGASKVRYRGRGKVLSNASGVSSVKRD